MAKQGIETVGELADAGPERLARILGRAHGTHLYRLAMGQDPRPVQTSREEKSIGKEETFFEHVADRGKLEKILLAQAHATARRLRRARLTARTVAIKVRFADFTTITRSTTFARPTDLAADLYAGAKHLFDSIAVSDEGLRLLGLRAEQTVDPREGVQLALGADSDGEAWDFGGQTDEGMHQAFGLNGLRRRSTAFATSSARHSPVREASSASTRRGAAKRGKAYETQGTGKTEQAARTGKVAFTRR